MQAEPPPLRSEDTSAVDLARKRLIKNKHPTPNLSLPRIPNLSSWWPGRRSRILSDQPTLPDDATLTEIDLNDAVDDLNIHQDIYRWAVVYENQRGCELSFRPIHQRTPIVCSISDSQFFLRHTTPVLDYFRMIHPHSPSLRLTARGINNLMCHCMTTPSPMVTGSGYPGHGWSICAAKAKSIMTGLSIIGTFVVISGARSPVRSAQEAWCVAEDGCAL